jgi:hypothetical protein
MTSQQCRPFVLHCGRCGAPGHTARECAMQRATLDKLQEQQWQVIARDSPIDRVSLPNTAEHEQTPAGDPPPSGWRDRPGLL